MRSLPPARWTNWARNVQSNPSVIATPRDVDEVAQLVVDAATRGIRVKPVGAGHSFTGLAATDGIQLRLDAMSGLSGVDRDRAQVRVLGGTRLSELNPLLEVYGLALPNLGDIDRQTVTGALATGTHGTGNRLPGLACQVVAISLVLADGTSLWCSRSESPEVFAAATVGLGALGVITEVSLQCVPAFDLQATERTVELHEVRTRWSEWTEQHDHVDLHWFPHTGHVLTKINDRVPAETPRRPVSRARRLLDDEILANGGLEAVQRVATLRPALTPWLNRLSGRTLGTRSYVDASARVFVSPRRMRFVETEYAVPRTSLWPVLDELGRWVDRHAEYVAIPFQVRTAAADELWLSTAYRRNSAYVAVHQYWRRDHRRLFAAFESIVAEHTGRPHWGKRHGLGPDRLRQLYPRFNDFLAVRQRLDPGRTFGSQELTRLLGP